MNNTLKIIFIMTGIFLIVGGFYTLSMEQKEIVILKTSLGEIEIELDSGKAPITVENFLKYVDQGYYNGLVFHRVIENFMIQGGGFDQTGKEKSTFPAIKLESNNGLKNLKGTIAMARTSVPNSATSQFFINLQDNSFLDHTSTNDGYAVFGKVVKGLEVVEKIGLVETTNKRGMDDWPVENILIISVTRK